MLLDEIIDLPSFGLNKEEKHRILDEYLVDLTRYHYDHCCSYRRMIDSAGVDINAIKHIEEIPFLPAGLFKDMVLKSIPDDDTFKTVTSSGTAGQKPSRIFLDRETCANQTKVLAKIVASFIGNKRLPMIIIDSPKVIKERNLFSARGAGVLGFSYFGSRRFYALDDEMELDVSGLKSFLEQHENERIFVFGFTFLIWRHFYKKLLSGSYRPDLSNAVMIHGGGWKQMVSESVSASRFKQSLHDVCGISADNIHDYYGMAEQTGSIYLECQCGHLHTSIFSDVIIRNPYDFSVSEIGEPGVVEVVSVLPKSYPGHVLLTEDEGVLIGEDDCPCGRKGKYFQIRGRLVNSELRGCSDTYAVHCSNSGPERLEYVIGGETVVNQMQRLPGLRPFDEGVVSFLESLSRKLMERGRDFPDVMALGFWCRKASVVLEKKRYGDLSGRLGRGVAFHIAPSNVPVIFVYSLISGLLAGNANVVRLPSKDFPQVNIITTAIKELLPCHSAVARYICIVKYPRSSEINDFFSGMCDCRVVWGGDDAIREIRQSPLKPRAYEMTFADRYSLAVIDGDEFLNAMDKSRIITCFYNDTYMFDQNACSSPGIVIWLGSRKEEAKSLFWRMLMEYAGEHYAITPAQIIGKLSTRCKAAADLDISGVESSNPFLTRIRIDKLDPAILDNRSNSGYFYEYDAMSLLDILPIVNGKCQTLSYYGLSQDRIRSFIEMTGPCGIDRVVPFGRTMEFSLVWDGYDLVESLSRVVSIR